MGDIDFDDRRPANLDGKGYWLGAHTFIAQVVQNKSQVGDDAKTTVGWAYAFSNRTSVYTSLTRFDNDGRAGSGAWAALTRPCPPA